QSAPAPVAPNRTSSSTPPSRRRSCEQGDALRASPLRGQRPPRSAGVKSKRPLRPSALAALATPAASGSSAESSDPAPRQKRPANARSQPALRGLAGGCGGSSVFFGRQLL